MDYDYENWLSLNNYPDTVNNQRYFAVFECKCEDPYWDLGIIHKPKTIQKMYYNNNNNSNFNNNRQYSSNNGGYQGNYNYNNYNNYNNRPKKKHSGCQTKTGQSKDGTKFHVTYGWMFRKGIGLVSYFAKTYKGTKSTTSQTGRTWLNVVVEVTNKQAGTSQLYTGMMEATSGRVTIKQLGIVMSPKGGRGGYVGPYGQK
jgi:hypothetical protein